MGVAGLIEIKVRLVSLEISTIVHADTNPSPFFGEYTPQLLVATQSNSAGTGTEFPDFQFSGGGWGP